MMVSQLMARCNLLCCHRGKLFPAAGGGSVLVALDSHVGSAALTGGQLGRTAA